ncbi:MAG: hypothetical protein MRQ09_00025 [Candidatus Midichloria sp.]|nr:hypothetical protein [Candidatus Midichloria sp.]
MSNVEQESFNSEAQENLAGYAANAITAIVTVLSARLVLQKAGYARNENGFNFHFKAGLLSVLIHTLFIS